MLHQCVLVCIRFFRVLFYRFSFIRRYEYADASKFLIISIILILLYHRHSFRIFVVGFLFLSHVHMIFLCGIRRRKATNQKEKWAQAKLFMFDESFLDAVLCCLLFCSAFFPHFTMTAGVWFTCTVQVAHRMGFRACTISSGWDLNLIFFLCIASFRIVVFIVIRLQSQFQLLFVPSAAFFRSPQKFHSKQNMHRIDTASTQFIIHIFVIFNTIFQVLIVQHLLFTSSLSPCPFFLDAWTKLCWINNEMFYEIFSLFRFLLG